MSEEQISSQFKEIDRNYRAMLVAIRVAFILIFLVLVSLNLYACALAGKFAQIYIDMLGGKPLPEVTLLALAYTSNYFLLFFLPVTVLLSVASMAYLWRAKSMAPAIILTSVVALFLFIQLLIITGALQAPMTSIIQDMSKS